MRRYFKILTVLLILSFEISAQDLASSLSETVVNTTTNDAQQRPTVALNTAGKYVAAWESPDNSDFGIFIRAFNADHTEVISQTRVNTSQSDGQRFPSVAMDDSDNFMVVWQSKHSGDWDIYFTLRNLSSGTIVSQTIVNTTTTGEQTFPKVVATNTGNFIVTWESDGDIYAQRFDNTGTALGSEFVVSNTTNEESYPSIATRYNEGSFVITWQSRDEDGDGYGIYAQRYNNTGTAQGTSFKVNTEIAENQIEPGVGMDPLGNFLITWSSYTQDGENYGVYGQEYNSSGSTVGSEIQISVAVSSTQHHSEVIALDDDMFVITWTSYDQDGDQAGVYTRMIDEFSTGNETLINTITSGYQQFSQMAGTQDGSRKVVFTWQDSNTDNYLAVFDALPVSLPEIEFTATPTDLGTILINTTLTQQYTIENTGTGTLDISSITSSNTATFTIQNAPTSVAPSSTATFDIVFSPSVVGSSSATITINNNDADESVVAFDVTGTGGVPEIEFTPTQTDFGLTPTNDSKNLFYVIENLGDAPLTVSSISSDNALFETSPSTLTVAAGSSATFAVTFRPIALGSDSATITITSNDDDESVLSFQVTGEACLGQGWTKVGDSFGGSNGSDFQENLAFAPNGTPYVAADNAVFAFENGTWTQKGSSVGGLNLAFAPNGTPYLLTRVPGAARVYAFENGDWAQKGNDFSGFVNFSSLAIAPDGTP
ncbi:MAG: choice-of-anchor D domain-containing protein, partial [Bacteroidota bacterium]